MVGIIRAVYLLVIRQVKAQLIDVVPRRIKCEGLVRQPVGNRARRDQEAIIQTRHRGDKIALPPIRIRGRGETLERKILSIRAPNGTIGPADGPVPT